MSEKYSLKDELYNPTKVHKIAVEIQAVYADFPQEAFEKDVLKKLIQLELKERMYHIRDMLHKYLPSEYEKAVNILLKALPKPLDTRKTDDDFGDFIYASYSEYVCAYGCCDEHVLFSLKALREITKRFSVEFAIRDFINHYPTQTLEMLETCAMSDNYHERRLASEGLRPKLPWAKKLTLEHTVPIRLLDTLYTDNTRYVTRSVANHLNDIAKIDASLVVDTLKRWNTNALQDYKEMTFIMNHALRTLVKVGDENALALLGFKKDADISVDNFILQSNEVVIGEALVFSFDIEANEEANLMVDYVIHFRTKSGTLNPKVHKVKKLCLKLGENMSISKKHLFKAGMSTRKLNAGEHQVSLQINGKIYHSHSFILHP